MWRTALRSRSCLVAATAATSFTGLTFYSHSIQLDQQKYNEKTPGVYAWGVNRNNVISDEKVPFVREPHRIPYFDGKLLRDLCLTEQAGVAVLENGDVVHWTKDRQPQLVVPGKNINRVKVSNGVVYGIQKSGSKVFYWELGKSNAVSTGWWSGDNAHVQEMSLVDPGWFERITDLQVGKDHLMVLTSKGRVFSGSTGMHAPGVSKGQYGVPSLSQFDTPPDPGVLWEVFKFSKLESKVEQIAAGEYHSLVRTSDGKCYGFGENIHGQLGIPFSYRNANVGVPTPIKLNTFKASERPHVSRIEAGGCVSYLTVDCENDQGERTTGYYAMGNGITGQLGSNNWSHAQSSPTRIKTLSELKEYDEKLHKMVQIGVNEWNVGPTHTAITLSSSSRVEPAEYGLDVMMFGGNEYSQIGTGKKNNVPGPINILPLDALRDKVDDDSTPELGNRMQLFKNRQYKFTVDGKSRSVKCDQVIHTGEYCTAVYYRKS